MKLRILQLISSAGFYGAENVLLELARELRRRGHDVTVGVFRNLHSENLELVQHAERDGLPTAVFDCGGRIDLRAAVKVGRYLRQRQIDVIHSHGYKSNIYGWLANLARQGALISTCHNWINANAKMRFYARLDRLVLRRFDNVVPVSRTVHEQLIQSGFDPKTLVIVENGINVERFQDPKLNNDDARAEFGFDPSCFVIGTVGRLSREKGHAVLIQAARKLFATHPRCKLFIVGDGDERGRLEQSLRDAGLMDRVVFAGTRQDIPRLLRAMNLFVLPSFIEAQPMSLLEAMAAGTPAVATTVGDVAKILQAGELGGLAPADDADSLERVMRDCVDHPDATRARAMRAQAHVAKSHSVQRMAEDYISIYRQALVSKGKME